jgi:hypothetical protein
MLPKEPARRSNKKRNQALTIESELARLLSG